MLGLVSTSSGPVHIEAIKIALPIGIGLASAAYLALKAAGNNGFSTDTTIPMASLRPGDNTHDAEYKDDQDAFLKRCETEYGPVFNIYLLNKSLTVISGPQTREVFMSENFSMSDSMEEFTGFREFLDSVKKSNCELDNRTVHEVVRDTISPNLPLFTPRIVHELEKNLEIGMKTFPKEGGRQFVEKPMEILQEMVAAAMAVVFVGPEVSKSREVIETFKTATYDFGKMLGSGNRRAKGFLGQLIHRANYRLHNPLKRHVQVLIDHSAPVVAERRRQEAEAIEKGVEWKRPDDILQRLLDNCDKYKFVDLEDVCGHLMVLVLASVHTTTDTSTNLLYYLAAFPQYSDKLYEEQQEVLDKIQQEREQQRQELRQKGEPIDESLDPSHDRDLSAAAVKKMVHMDSFVREVFRFRTERLTLIHRTRKDVTLSSGIVISKGSSAIVNIRSVHQSAEQGEDATEFRPWRFVGKPKAATKAGSDFLAFGMGRHACPGRFLAIQELKTIGVLMVSKYSRIEIEDPKKTMRSLRTRIGEATCTGLTFISRN